MLLGNGDGTFQPQHRFEFAWRDLSETVVAGDFTGDGRLDLAVRARPRGGVLPGNGDGTFQPHVMCTR